MYCKRLLISIITIILVLVVFMQVVAIPSSESVQIPKMDQTDSFFSALNSNRFTHLPDTAVNTVNYSVDGFNPVAENENFTLYIREESAALRILDKSSGYVWGTLATDEPDDLNESWSAFANSLVSIEYTDEQANSKRIGAGSEEATRTYDYEKNAVVLKVEFDSLQISVAVRVELTAEGLAYSVDDKSVLEKGDYYIRNLYFTPFLGSTTGNTVPGYMFIPDGCGALIKLDGSTKYMNGFSGRVYGPDYAIDNLLSANDLDSSRPNDFAKKTEEISIPVYGIVHGSDQNALFARVENGAEYAEITAIPSGVYTDYNWASVGFMYRQLYQQPTSKSGAGVQTVQKERNEINPKLDVYFLNGEKANYVGMACKYRDILERKKKLPSEMAESKQSVALDFIMEDIQKGFFVSSSKKLTSLEQVNKAVKDLQDSGVQGMHISLKGWQKGGLNGFRKNTVYNNAMFGNFESLSSLKSLLDSNGAVSLYIDPLTAREPQMNESSDAGISLSQSAITHAREDETVYLGKTWYLKYPLAMKRLLEQGRVLQNAKIDSMVIDGGNLLYGEYLKSDFVSRSQAKKLAQEAISDLAKNQSISLFQPNEFLFAYTSEYRNISMSSSQYIYETDSVPFLQILLSGKMTLFAPYSNDCFYSKDSILKCIEYNCYPSFLLTGETNDNMKKTSVAELCSTNIDDWKGIISDTYNQIAPILSEVRGDKIENRIVIDEGVIAVTYSSGKEIFVNYCSEDYQYKGITIPAFSAICQKEKVE